MITWQDNNTGTRLHLQSVHPPHGDWNLRKLDCDVVRPCLQVVMAVQPPTHISSTHIEPSLRGSRHSCTKDVSGLK
jgi:hypothetical protein